MYLVLFVHFPVLQSEKLKVSGSFLLDMEIQNLLFLGVRGRLFCNLLMGAVLSSCICVADLTFSVSDNGDSTTDWTLSGSGTTTASNNAGNNLAFRIAEFLVANPVTATSGAWSFNGHTTDTLPIKTELFSTDSLQFSFDSDFSSGESLADASGTVTFPIAFGDLSLPASSALNGYFGTMTITAVPEPSTGFALVTCLLGFVAVWRKRRQ